MPPLIEIVAVTHKQPGPLRVFVQSFLNQTADNWKLAVWHDGPDADFDALMATFADSRITGRSTPVRHNDWGHSLRAAGLAEAASDYVLLTNGDNYYVPKFIEAVTTAAEKSQPDVIAFDMIHSHLHYKPMETLLVRNRIDVGAAVVRTGLAKAVGFRDRRPDGDATYFEDLRRAKPDLSVVKIANVLFVHN